VLVGLNLVLQTFTAPCNGYYKLEVWGASGYSYNSTYRGGYGGYSTGVENINKNSVNYINVGQLGFGTCAANSKYGPTYNGAGEQTLDPSSSQAVYNRCSGAGGGATHIATVSGVLKNLSAYKDTDGTNVSKEILIVPAEEDGMGAILPENVRAEAAALAISALRA